MKAYPNYKESKVEWIGEIPTHWEMRKVSRSFNLIGSGTTPKSDNAEYYDDGTIPWVMTGDLNDGLLNSTSKKVTKKAFDDHSALKVFPAGTLLVAMYGATIGKISIMGFEGCTNQACCALSDGPLINTKFAFYWFLANKKHVISLSYGGGQPNISQDIIRTLKISTPPLPEQQAISDFLDRKTAQIDTLIEKKQRQIDMLQEQRTALINHAVTKGLNPDVRMKDSGVEGLGKIPNHWGVKQLRHIIKEGTSITYGIVQAGPNYEGGIPYIRTQDMSGSELPRDGYLKTSPEIDLSYERSKVNSGDIVIAIRATVGKALVVPEYLDGANLTQGTAKVSPSDFVHKKYLFWAINSDACQNYISSISKGVTFKEITLYMLRRVRIPFPPLIEQEQISNYLNDKTHEVDLAIERVRKQMDLLDEYRTALISEAVTGKIDVRTAV